MSQDLWAWSVRAWRSPGVADRALELQDHAGQNPPLLLWAAWAALGGRTPDAEIIEAACDLTRAWEDRVTAPIRAVRRALKTPLADMDDGARLAFRDAVKQTELEAERRLLEALSALSTESPAGAPTEPAEALIAVARGWGPKTPRAGLLDLAARLPAVRDAG